QPAPNVPASSVANTDPSFSDAISVSVSLSPRPVLREFVEHSICTMRPDLACDCGDTDCQGQRGHTVLSKACSSSDSKSVDVNAASSVLPPKSGIVFADSVRVGSSCVVEKREGVRVGVSLAPLAALPVNTHTLGTRTHAEARTETRTSDTHIETGTHVEESTVGRVVAGSALMAGLEQGRSSSSAGSQVLAGSESKGVTPSLPPQPLPASESKLELPGRLPGKLRRRMKHTPNPQAVPPRHSSLPPRPPPNDPGPPEPLVATPRSNFVPLMNICRLDTPLMKRLPQSQRTSFACVWARCLEAALRSGFESDWSDFFILPRCILWSPARAGKRVAQPSEVVKRRLARWPAERDQLWQAVVERSQHRSLEVKQSPRESKSKDPKRLERSVVSALRLGDV